MSKTTGSPLGGGLIALVAGALLLGTVGIASALWNRIQATPPLTITVLRLGFSAPFLFALAGLTARRNPLYLARRNWPRIGALGAAMAICQSCFFLAIPLAGVTLVVVLSLCSAPLFVVALSIPLFGERLTRRSAGAVGLAVVGTGLLVGGGHAGSDLRFDVSYLSGVALALVSGAGYAAFIVLAKVATQASRLSSSQIVAWAFATAWALLMPITVVSGSLQLNLRGPVWAIAVYMGLVPTGLAYFLLQIGLHTTQATLATLVTLLEPVVAAGLAAVLLGDPLTAFTAGGAGLLVSGVGVLAWPQPAVPS